MLERERGYRPTRLVYVDCNRVRELLFTGVSKKNLPERIVHA